ncbi:hypothetical protein [Phormidium sp. FACHB-1136]|uniref:hypothetical protein n=1 Tax=Phormidium sp. FACHB-1136 TaxID=2692848 RepID=UPI001687E762|nr:hypothetical protein [Phormidium sp. FACHB-1136]MBD2429199.1 hypothetical protein [Phormidium sp. FACHB-1136]
MPLSWHGVRLTFVALFLVALFRVETVNLDQRSSVFANRAKPESSYKRLTRFLRVFPKAKVRCLTGDREFVGKDGCIETLFSALKTRGFNLESTHLCHAERLSKLVALLALGFCWAMRSGLWHHQHQPIAIKAHGRRAKSLFRCGCDFLRRICCDLTLWSAE